MQICHVCHACACWYFVQWILVDFGFGFLAFISFVSPFSVLAFTIMNYALFLLFEKSFFILVSLVFRIKCLRLKMYITHLIMGLNGNHNSANRIVRVYHWMNGSEKPQMIPATKKWLVWMNTWLVYICIVLLGSLLLPVTENIHQRTS